MGWMSAFRAIPWNEVIAAAPAAREPLAADDPLAVLRARVAELQEQQAAVSALVQSLAEQNEKLVAAVGVEQVELKDVKLALAAGPVPAFDARVELSAAGQPRRLRAATRDGKLYGGTLVASTELHWDKGFAANGNVTLQGVAMEPLLALFAQSVKMSGWPDTGARFSAVARDAAKLAEVLRADGGFVVRDGVLHNVDLARAASLMGGSRTRGGSTKFDELTGNYHVAGKSYRLERLQVRSGLLNAQGDVAIAPSHQLDGKVNVELKSGVAWVVVPLRVAGTTQEPVLYPTGAAVEPAAPAFRFRYGERRPPAAGVSPAGSASPLGARPLSPPASPTNPSGSPPG